MARDHARIQLDIWGDDAWLDLPVDAQALYLTLYTSPGRTLCGAHEWNPGKLTQRAGDWTTERVEAAAEILSRELFLIIDPDTDECLLRSWIKHDGLWRTPNMAVSVANARASLASRTLRGVITFEVLKLKKAEPKSSSWDRDTVQNMLRQKAVDPTELEPFKGVSNGGRNPVSNPGAKGGSNPTVNEIPTHGVNPGSNGAPTISTAIPTAINNRGSYVSGERNEGDDDPPSDDPPPKFCPQHRPNGTPGDCSACGVHRRRREDWLTEQRAAFKAEVAACPSCDDDGHLLGDDGLPADRVARCPAHNWSHAHV